MSKSSLLTLGFMTFALFLGAGNVIFPPQLGQGSGEFFWPATIGFLITAVGLPALTLIAIGYMGGSEALTNKLPRAGHLMFWGVLFLSIGPLFSLPRTFSVSFEFIAKPFFADWALLPFTLVMAATTLFFALSPGKLMDRIGKILTPVLLLMLLFIAISAFLYPHGQLENTAEQYQSFAIASGLSEGYMTMDVLGAVGFGWLVINALKSAAPNAPVVPNLIKVVLISSVAMCFVYIAIAFVGANYGIVESNGGALLSNYMNWIYGTPGVLLMGVIVTLACLTTAIGLTCACAEFTSQNFKSINYRTSTITIVAITTLVANLGLDLLIAITLPLVVVLHPVAISIILLGLFYLKRPFNGLVYSLTIAAAITGGVVDALKILGNMPEQLHNVFVNYLPLYQYNAGWIVPTLVVFAVANMLFQRKENTAQAAA
ncbi:branched-chain amino acid transport system II carrier protein [Pseudoalteromonas phenolica]|uniref:Branched-chain amino acid transport system carrier protein n=1 Tax=Pseudoalteromonas phenolica TaxID=161398 RepID=A0A5R9Q3F9_9GAMM|nr:branched-chain amino acid transport system II carrier protein [Pseudoalteromonas phenolica]TLX46789.1 branched-chain amino acid transport system II carrier protein [Pseudoalteromonas phenolica]